MSAVDAVVAVLRKGKGGVTRRNSRAALEGTQDPRGSERLSIAGMDFRNHTSLRLVFKGGH
jgi:hypothetical protein